MQIFGSMFRNVGLVTAFLAAFIAGYEVLALVTSLPTLSRIMQGWRDAGKDEWVFLLSLVFVCIFAIFGAWLYYHLNYEPRSGN